MKFCEALKKCHFHFQLAGENWTKLHGRHWKSKCQGSWVGRTRGQSLNAVKHIHLSNFILLIRLLSGVDGCRPYFCISVCYIFWESETKSPKGSIRHQASASESSAASVVLKDYKRFLEKWQSDYIHVSMVAKPKVQSCVEPSGMPEMYSRALDGRWWFIRRKFVCLANFNGIC